MCSDIPGCVEEWHIPGKTAGKRVHYRSQTRTIEWLSAWHQTVLVMFLGFRKLLYSCTEGMFHSSTRPGTSLHVTQFYQAWPPGTFCGPNHDRDLQIWPQMIITSLFVTTARWYITVRPHGLANHGWRLHSSTASPVSELCNPFSLRHWLTRSVTMSSVDCWCDSNPTIS